jgi:hypothetical protein
MGEEVKNGNSGANMIKVHHIYEWKCHNETPHFVELIHANKNLRKLHSEMVL